MYPDLAYAASYLLFRHAAYVHRCLRAVRLAGGRPSPLQRCYRRKGRRLVTIMTACQSDPAPPVLAPGSDNLPF